MLLAGMLRTDESALICDLAETYHVYNFRELPLKTAAALAAGLRENSRIRKKLTGVKLTTEQFLLAVIADRLGLLWWAKTPDGHKNRNRPKRLLDILTAEPQEPENASFATGEEFEQARQRILSGGER